MRNHVRTTRISRTLIATAAIALCTVTVGPAQATHGQPDKELPIAIELVSSSTDRDFVNTDVCSVPSAWVWKEVGTGTASRLGTVTYSLWHCTQLTSPVGGTYQDGLLVITAANGDRLELQHYGTFAVDEAEGLSTAEGSSTIVGGTGRFAGASGELSERAEFHFTSETQYATASGHIVYDASNRADR
jgi:hypothetical protein